MLWLAVGHSVSAVPLQCPFCQHHPFLSQVSQPPPLPFTNEPAPTPCSHGPVHPTTSPSKVFQAPVPAGASPEKLFPRSLCLLGLPLCGPALFVISSSQGPCGPVLPSGAFPLAPVPGGCAPVHPAVPPVAVFFHGHTSGTQTPAPCARLTGPCPASGHAFPSPPAFPNISLPRPVPLFAHLPAALRAAHPCVVEIFAGSCNFSSTAVSMGFQSVVVDHVPAKRWHVLQLDLREPGAGPASRRFAFTSRP